MSDWNNYEKWRPVMRGNSGELSHYHFSGKLPVDKEKADRNLTATGYSLVMDLRKGGAGSRRRTVHKKRKSHRKSKRVHHTHRKQSHRHRHSRRRHHR
jgi:hypothetical protein